VSDVARRRRRHRAGVVFLAAENLREKENGLKSTDVSGNDYNYIASSTVIPVTLVLIMLRLMRLNFRFKAQYMNGFQKLLLSAIHVMMKSTADGICANA